MMKRFLALGAVMLMLVGCAQDGEQSALKDLGDFTLGHNIVVAPDMQKGPTSRDATPEELTEALTVAIDKRLGRYEGERLVHLGVNISAYALARRGVPLVYTPKSLFAVTVTAWDDRANSKFHDKPKQIIAFESFGDAPIIGTGYTKSREEQIESLAANTARHIENWLEDNAVCMTDEVTEEQLESCWKDAEIQAPDA